MKVSQLDHLNMSVNDLKESADWYGRVFGFEVVEDALSESGVPFMVLRSGSAMLCIYQRPERATLNAAGLEERKLHGFNHFGLRIDDREDWEGTIEREGLEVLYGGVLEWPHSLAWYVTDPSGYEIEVALWNGDEIAFTESGTNPLSTESGTNPPP